MAAWSCSEHCFAERLQLRHHRLGIDSAKKRIGISTNRLHRASRIPQHLFKNVPAAPVHRIDHDGEACISQALNVDQPLDLGEVRLGRIDLLHNALP